MVYITQVRIVVIQILLWVAVQTRVDYQLDNFTNQVQSFSFRGQFII